MNSKKLLIFTLSNNSEENTAIALKSKSILTRNLPNTEAFNYVILKLSGVRESLPVKKSKNVRAKSCQLLPIFAVAFINFSGEFNVASAYLGKAFVRNQKSLGIRDFFVIKALSKTISRVLS